MKLSVVSTLYRSAPFLGDFIARASNAAQYYASDDYEIVLVNDGSPDDSLERAIQFSTADSHVVVVDLSRNFGHHKAMMTGLEHARGEHVFLIDCDLEEPPECLALMQQTLQQNPDADVVYGVQPTRKGGWMERLSGSLFYRLFCWMSGLDLPHNFLTARLMSARYVRALVTFREREIFIGGLWHIVGFKQIPVTVEKLHKGQSTYSLSRKFSLMVNGITSFSNRPLTFIFYLGLLITAASGCIVAYYVFRYLVYGSAVSGWTSVIVSLWALGGLILLSLGVIGIYLAKIFSETKQRPATIVRAIHGR